MNSVIKGFGYTIIILLIVLILSSIVSKTNRSNEIKESLNTSIQQTIKIIKDKRYDIASNEELIAEFNRNLILQLNSDSKVDVAIYEADYINGLLDAEITLTFTYPHGKQDTVSTRKTVLLDNVEVKES